MRRGRNHDGSKEVTTGELTQEVTKLKEERLRGGITQKKQRIDPDNPFSALLALKEKF